MPKINEYININKKPVEIVQELKDEYQIPSFEEFMKNYENDVKVNDSYDLEVDSYDDIRESKKSGPMYRFTSALLTAVRRREVSEDVALNILRLMDESDDLQGQIDRISSNIRDNINVSVNINIYNVIVQIVNQENITIRIPLITSPSIDNVVFNTTGSTQPDNYRGVGSIFGLVGNVIGGLIKDESRHKPSGILFASVKRKPLSFWSFWQTASLYRTPGSDRVDFHDDKIICSSRSNLTELKSKIGDIVEVWEFSRFSSKNRVDKEREFKNTVQNLLDRHDGGRDINGHYTI